jgi:Photosynthetic reaction centre cytochrome C subunit
MTTSFPHPPQSHRPRGLAVALVAFLMTSLAAGAHAVQPPKPSQPSQPPPSDAPAKAPAASAAPAAPQNAGEPTAGEKFKNIKVLRSMPASQMLPVMHLMRASLGVTCDFCHVVEGDQFEADTKKEKETARRMIQMVLDINKANFEGRTVVTCNTCHNGHEHPVAVPPIGQGLFADTTRASPESEPEEKLPSAAQILDRYVEALGGKPALLAVKSRTSRGTLLHIKVIDSGTPKARAVNRGAEDPLEIVQQGPGKVTVTFGPPKERTVYRLDGTSGTIETPEGKRPMNPREIVRFTALSDLGKDLDLRERADKMRVAGKDKIDGRDVYILRAPTAEGGRENLYFDVQTGLLRRRLTYRPTVIGADPEQTDFEDYRAVGGVKVPFTVKISYLDDNHLGITRKFTEIRNNVD